MPDYRTSLKVLLLWEPRARLGGVDFPALPIPAAHATEDNMTQVSRYHPLLAALHWILAALIMAALALGVLVMARIPNASAMKFEALRSHMLGGTLILVLMLVRLVVRMRTRHPAAASAGHPLLDRLAWTSHRLLYVAVLGLTTSGWLMALQTGLPGILFGGGTLPADFWVYPIRTAHYLFSRVLMALIALHIVGALYHTLLLRDGLLRRMLFGRRIVAAADVPTALANQVSEKSP
jgi:cytochrome b561